MQRSIGDNAVAYSDDRQVLYTSTYSIDLLDDQRLSLPISVFSSGCSGLQAIVRYLRERGSANGEIAELLRRSPKTIAASYEQARRREFAYEEAGLRIPVEIFCQRDLSVLESLCVHLAGLGLANVEIARLLNLDPRTTWTVKTRAAAKGVAR